MQFWSPFKDIEWAILVQIQSKTLYQNCICEANPTRGTELRIFQHAEFYPHQKSGPK